MATDFRVILDLFVWTKTGSGSNPQTRIRICNPGFQVDGKQRLCAADHRWSRQLFRNQSISEERERGLKTQVITQALVISYIDSFTKKERIFDARDK